MVNKKIEQKKENSLGVEPSDTGLRGNSWILPSQRKERVKLPTAEEVEAIRKDAYDEGFKEGKIAGCKKGEEEYAKKGGAHIKSLLSILKVLQDPLAEQEVEIEKMLTHMIEQMVRALVLKELSIDSASLSGILSEALETVRQFSNKITVYLNAKDLPWIQTQLQANEDFSDLTLSLQAKPGVHPGGGLVENEYASVDFTIEKRMNDFFEKFYDQGSE